MNWDDSDGSDGTMLDDEPLSKTEWAEMPTDPDPRRNLGYELRDWEVVTTSKDSDQVVFLPEDAELLRDEAFVIIERDTLCSLEKRR